MSVRACCLAAQLQLELAATDMGVSWSLLGGPNSLLIPLYFLGIVEAPFFEKLSDDKALLSLMGGPNRV